MAFFLQLQSGGHLLLAEQLEGSYLTEDGDDLLAEDGSTLETEGASGSGDILLEDGTSLLGEDGESILLEGDTSGGALLLNGGFLECSITITGPPPPVPVGIQQWRLHQFHLKARIEQSA